MTTTVNGAKNTQIYFVESTGSGEYKIATDNLYDFVMLSAEETTSPRGVEMKLHIRNSDYPAPRFASYAAYPREEDTFEVWTWGINGNNPQFIESFDTEDEAEDFIFNRTYEFDFLPDDQRSTVYFNTHEEAEQELIETIAGNNNISYEAAESYYRHSLKAADLRAQKEEGERNRIVEQNRLDAERVQRIAAEYVNLIEPVDGENYKRTAARLSAAIGERIESRVFHAAVKIIRKK